MEELLKQILEGQKTLFNEIKDLKSGQQRLEEEVSTIKQEVSTIKQEISPIKEEVSTIKQEISTVKQEVSTIKQKMGTKTQQYENTDIIKALLHNQEEFSAQLEALTLNTVSKTTMENVATKEDISKLDARFQVLNSRLFNQETEITQLKAVK